MARKKTAIPPQARKLAALALAAGMSCRQTAQGLQVSHDTVNNWVKDPDFQDEINRLKSTNLERNAYSEYLEESQARLVRCAAALRETSIRFLTLANHRLQRISPDDVPVAQLPKFVAAAASALSTSVQIEEQTLGLNTILEHIHKMQKDNQLEDSD